MRESSVMMWWESGEGRMLGLCVLANLINSADRVIMPVALMELGKEKGYSLEQQGWVLSAFPAGYISSQIVGSCAGRQLGTWRLLLCVVLMWSLATLLTPPAASTFHLLLLSRLILGLGEGLGLPTMYTLLAESIPVERRSRAFGYLQAFGSIGQTLAALLSPHVPWRVPFYFCGLLGFLWCAFWIANRRHYQPPLPDSLLLKQASNPMRQWRVLLTSSPLVAVYVAHFAMNWTAYVVMHWLPTYLAMFLRARPHGVSLACLPYAANSVASMGVGHLADWLVNRRGYSLVAVRRLCTGLGLALPALFLFAFAGIGDLFTAVLLVSLSMAALALNSGGHLANHADLAPRLAGITFAISNTLATLPGLLVGPLTARLVVESSGRWWPVFLLAGMVNLTGCVFYLGHAKAKQIL